MTYNRIWKYSRIKEVACIVFEIQYALPSTEIDTKRAL